MVKVVELTNDTLLSRICKRLRKSAISVLGGSLLAEFPQLTLFPRWSRSIWITAWEQRKLGDIAHRITRKNEGESDLPLTISAQYGLVDQRTFFNNQVASKDMSGYYLLRKGEFAYNKSTSGDSPWGAVKRLEKYEKGCISTLYICFGLDDAAPNFLVTYYETDRWYKTVQVIAAEGARNHGLLNIAPDDFFDTALKLPSSREEQERIGALFSRLDSLITLHQRQSNGKAHNIIILSRTKNRQLDIAKSAVQGLETRGNSRKLLNEHPIQQRFLDIP